MKKPITCAAFDKIIRAALKQGGIDPAGTGSVPFEKLTAIGRAVRTELDRLQASDDELQECFNYVVSETLDKSMTAARRQAAIDQLAAGFRFKITWPS